MPHRMRAWLTACGLPLALLLLGVATGPIARAAPDWQPDGEAASQAAAMLELVNQARREAGLVPYVANAKLARAAQGHAVEIATDERFSHTGRDGRTAEQRVIDAVYGAGREGLRVGENFVGRATVEEAFAWLMEDPPHRENILHPDFREVGMGVGEIRWGYIWVMDLATYEGIEAVLAQPQAPAQPTEPEPTEPASEPIAEPAVTVTLPPAWTMAPEPVETPGTPPGDPGAPEQGGGRSTVFLAFLAVLLLLALLVGGSWLAKRPSE